MAKQSEVAGILSGIADQLAQDKTEILAEIATLKTSLDGEISPETQASIDRLQALATDLHNVDAPVAAPAAATETATS